MTNTESSSPEPKLSQKPKEEQPVQAQAAVAKQSVPLEVPDTQQVKLGRAEVKTGGKLYLAGEYAILEPGQKALIQYIPFHLEAVISPASQYQIQSDLFDYVVGLEPDENYGLIQDSIQVMEEFLREEGLKLSPFDLAIRGQLGKNGVKYGLGSSGSVTLLVIKALAALYDYDLTADLAFRLASLVLLKRGDNGSMGDLAAIAHQGLVLYQSFDRARVRDQYRQHGLMATLDLDWGYEIHPVKPGRQLDFLVGWTQKPALSKSMINLVKKRITPAFLSDSKQAVEDLERALVTGDQDQIVHYMHTSCHLLNELSPQIYTEELRSLKISQAGLDAVAKVSGAGGGDCGIALSFNQDSSQKIEERWSKKGIETIFQGRLGHYD